MADIHRSLRTFFEPQAEQLRIDLRPVGFGLAGEVRRTDARGRLWVAAIGDDCLLSAHCVTTAKPFNLVERPDDYACIASVSAAVLASCPKSASAARGTGNVTAFAQEGGTVSCVLEAGDVYESRNICLRPSFFDRLAARYGKRYGSLLERVRDVDPDALSPAIGKVLADIGSEAAAKPGAGLLLESRVCEALFLVADGADERERARDGRGSIAQRRLVQEACELIERDLSRPVPLAELAARLYTSRARLCAAFKEETGESVGSFSRARRLERACELLAGSDRDLGAIARAVGYRRPGSFTEAFERAYGMPPSASRAMRRP